MRYRVCYLMDEIWERAVETAIDGQTDNRSVKNLTLDGAVKCVHGRLPPPTLFEKFPNLEHLSLANIGVSSLEQFPKLSGLEKLILSDNRIASGLEYLVEAGLDSLRDLDLSNNRISDIEDLEPLARLRIVSLDLYECPITRVKDYRARVFGLIRSLKYLDKMDAEENEREESDDEEESGDEEEEMEEDDDPGSGEVDGDGEDRPFRVVENGQNGSAAVGGRLPGVGGDGIVDVDEESDADEEETEIVARIGANNGLQSNGFQVLNAVGLEGEDDDDDDDEENYSGEEIDEEDGEDDEVVEVHEIDDSEDDDVDDDDGVEEFDEDDDDDEDEDEEEVDNEERDLAEPEGTGRRASTEGEIDGHEQGEDEADEDDNGETGEEEQEVEEEEDGEDEEEDSGEGYLVQAVGQADEEGGGGSDMDPGNEEEDPEGEEEVENEDNRHDQIQMQPSSSSRFKRKRDDDDDDDDDGGEGDGDEEDDVVGYQTSSRKRV